MKKLLSILFFSSLFVVFLFIMFADVEQYISDLLQSPASLAVYSVFSFFFLMSDIVLPVPSSMIMILNGKVLGVFYGTMLSLLSGLFSSCLGFYLGRRSNNLLSRFFSRQDVEEGNSFVARYGSMAIAFSKAIPVLSESVSFVSGTTAISLKNFLLYSFAGHAVVAILYAYVGSLNRAIDSNLISAAIIGLTIVLAWGLQVLIRQGSASQESRDGSPKPAVTAKGVQD
jgi:uncharacterized membrane protein YdjX (TVP38/TMEM64 family)